MVERTPLGRFNGFVAALRSRLGVDRSVVLEGHVVQAALSLARREDVGEIISDWESVTRVLLGVTDLFAVQQSVPPEVVVGALGSDWPVTDGLVAEVRSGFVTEHIQPVLAFRGWTPDNRLFFARLCQTVKASTDPLNWTPDQKSRRVFGHWRSREELDALIEETSQTLVRLQALRPSHPTRIRERDGSRVP